MLINANLDNIMVGCQPTYQENLTIPIIMYLCSDLTTFIIV